MCRVDIAGNQRMKFKGSNNRQKLLAKKFFWVFCKMLQENSNIMTNPIVLSWA